MQGDTASTRHRPLESPEWISREDLQRYAQRGTLARVWNLARNNLQRSWRSPLRFWYALKIAGRSFRGHIALLLAKKHWGVDLGPLLQSSADGCLREDTRTHARSAGITQLTSLHSWANTIDSEIFLLGFEWGERYALGTLSIPPCNGSESCESSHVDAL
jgi:hypothetical protein